MSVKIVADALAGAISYFERMPEVSNQAASIAINQVAQRSGMRLAQDAIYDQIGFPKDYLQGDRLYVGKFARPNDLSASIVGRKRATSLARFAQGGAIGGGRTSPSLSVRVKGKSGATVMRGAWLVRLRKGASLDEDNFNVGLAIRIKPGETVKNKGTAHQSWLVKPDDKHGGVALLYGPSVNQVFKDVAGDIAEPIGTLVSTEFFRQFARLSKA